uniref:Uncharacterized protein n=1 Tax=Pristionchus pacificus TaxID=54126 RepID=A0A2A6CDR4_PRIPA|eukprot:PDM76230.1 hypothetical protein PRIPAC_39834 [Pristionchus pacificus]
MRYLRGQRRRESREMGESPTKRSDKRVREREEWKAIITIRLVKVLNCAFTVAIAFCCDTQSKAICLIGLVRNEIAFEYQGLVEFQHRKMRLIEIIILIAQALLQHGCTV